MVKKIHTIFENDEKYRPQRNDKPRNITEIQKRSGIKIHSSGH